MLVLLGGAAAVVGADDAVGSVEPVCAPPLLLMVTPEPASVVDEVAPDVVVVPAAVVVPVLVDVDPVLVDVDVGVVDEVEVPVAAEPVDDASVDVELVEDDSEDVLVVSAAANP